MPQQFKAGEFTFPTSTGNFSVTDVGFKPNAVIFYYTWLGTPDNNGAGYGFTTSPSKNYSIGWNGTDAAGTINCSRRQYDTHCITLANAEPSTNHKQASLVSFNGDGFTLNFTTADATANVKCRYFAFGEGIFQKAASGVVDAGGALTTTSVTGLGFKPDILFCINIMSGSGTTWTNSSAVSFGAGTPSSQFAHGCIDIDGVGIGQCYTWQKSGAVSLIYDGTNTGELGIQSFDNDGFTLNCPDVYGSGWRSYWLAAKLTHGGNVAVGLETKPTTATSKATTGLGFRPEAVLFSGYGNASAAAGRRHYISHIGSVDRLGNQFSQSSFSFDNSVNAECQNKQSSNRAIIINAYNDVTTGQATGTLDADGFTLNWDVSDSTARQFGYVALTGVYPTSSQAHVLIR